MKARFAASRERAQAEERYRSLVDHASDGITIVDLDSGKFMEEANPRMEALFGLSRDDLLGKLGIKDLSPELQPDGRTSAEAAVVYGSAAFNDAVQRFEWIFRTVDGIDFPCLVTLARFPHPTHRMVRASVVDLREQKKAEQARLELEQKVAQLHRLELIGQMTGDVAHDFNNVLSVLMGNLELLDEKAEDPEVKSIIKSAMDATEHGAGLTRAMLNYSRQAPLKPETFRLSDVVRKMKSLMSRTIPSRISIETDFEGESWAIAADLRNTESAILNLVLNACDATPNDGRIEICAIGEEVSECSPYICFWLLVWTGSERGWTNGI
jgi:PAS domain S-box-containing protein